MPLKNAKRNVLLFLPYEHPVVSKLNNLAVSSDIDLKSESVVIFCKHRNLPRKVIALF